MVMQSYTRGELGIAVIAVAAAWFGGAAAADFDTDADRILREASEYLQAAGEFTFRAEIAYDEVISTGEKIQYGGTVDVAVRRPDRLRVRMDGDERRMHLFYDGSTITVYNPNKDFYAVTEAPDRIDTAVDLIFDKFGITVPIADLVYADPYAVLTANVESVSVIGLHGCSGRRCHHLAFTQEGVDWQIWIEDGPQPVPRKLVINYKNQPGSPQYEARFTDWDFRPLIADGYFRFHPPDGADQIEFALPAAAETAP